MRAGAGGWVVLGRHARLVPHRVPLVEPPRCCCCCAQIAAARRCVYQNHIFLSALLNAFAEEEGAPPHLAAAGAAADEWAAKSGGRVTPEDVDKVRRGARGGSVVEAALGVWGWAEGWVEPPPC